MLVTEDELKRALPMLLNVAVYCSAYHHTFMLFYPRAAIEGAVVHHPPELVPTFDAVIEGTLLNLRKSAEFFKPMSLGDRDDSLYSYRYPGFIGQGWIVHKNDYVQFHKRVGHLTLEEVREGRVSWDTMTLAVAALRKWAEFFAALVVTYNDDKDTSRYCSDAARVLTAKALAVGRLGIESRAMSERQT